MDPTCTNVGDEAAETNQSVASDSLAPERDPDQEETSSSNSDSSSEQEQEGPRRKKLKRDSQVTVDPRIDALYNQVSFLTNLIMHQPCVSNLNAHQNEILIEKSNEVNSDFLTNPSTAKSKSLDLGFCKTDFDEKKVLKPADDKRLRQLMELQHFKSPTWQHIRYKKTLAELLASPGFCKLKINDEMCSLNKGKDFLAPTEDIMAATTNALLHQRELLQSGLQGIIDWAHKNPAELNPDRLFSKFTEAFGKSSSSYKLSEQTLQIVCGKRAECIELRRRRLIAEISDKSIQAALNNIPPSEEFLFDKTTLNTLIQSLGGPHFWIQPQAPKIREHLKRKYKEPTPSTSRAQTQNKNNFRDNYKKQQTQHTYKGKNESYKQNKNTTFRNKDTKK
ncbi:jg22141 [Pararge aegeria aegeria]|uniref:Jg22141 protein n=1 Tax=Pararge aegeria aegeria TaxID=348720 RepID=A0A8S4QJF4_9NEOP|nr:jg22141 [Pararge aegeria aegeria]